MPFSESQRFTPAPAQAVTPADPTDQQLLLLFRALCPEDRELIVLLIAKWASHDAKAKLSLVRPRTA